MGNNFFQFKQFTVFQDKCSMKVCTDACVFGGWLANKMTIIGRDSQNFLDIGTGTGLLSLMVAQKSSVEIDAIEIEENAFVQARENFRSSPWSKVLHAIHGDVTTYPFRKKYDLIICKPPFDESDLRSPDDKKNQARHDESLRLDELVNVVSNLLNSDGYFAVMLPFHRLKYFENLAAQKNIYVNERFVIRQTPLHDNFRVILCCSRNDYAQTGNELIIKDSEGNYTAEYSSVLKDFYLYV